MFLSFLCCYVVTRCSNAHSTPRNNCLAGEVRQSRVKMGEVDASLFSAKGVGTLSRSAASHPRLSNDGSGLTYKAADDSPLFSPWSLAEGRSSVATFDSCEPESVQRAEGRGDHAAPRQPYRRKEWDGVWRFIACDLPRKSVPLGQQIIRYKGNNYPLLHFISGGDAACLLLPCDRGARSDQGAPGGESGRAV